MWTSTERFRVSCLECPRFLPLRFGRKNPVAEMDDLVAMLEQWEPANVKLEYQFVVRQYAIGKGHSVSVLWRGGEVDRIFGFEKEADALDWLRTKSQGWLVENKKAEAA
jgi:hypothetical protein